MDSILAGIVVIFLVIIAALVVLGYNFLLPEAIISNLGTFVAALFIMVFALGLLIIGRGGGG